MASSRVKKVAARVNDANTIKIINLPNPYNGVPSNMRIIPAGIYQIDDPVLLGLGEYLVSSLHAQIVNEISADEADTFEDPPKDDDGSEDDEPKDPENPPV